MPSPGGAEVPIRLVSGGDRWLSACRCALAAAGLLAIWISGWPLLVRLLAAVATLALWLLLERSQRSAPAAHLRFDPGGGVTLDGRPVTLLPDAWVTPLYTVVRVQTEQRVRWLLLSSTKQAEGEYRKLLTWMRWRTRNQD